MTLRRQILFVAGPVPAQPLVYAPDPETKLAVLPVVLVVVAVAVVVAGRRAEV